MGELSKLPNIGKNIEEQLNQVGITTEEELKYCGAIQGIKKTLLSKAVKTELKVFYQQNKK